jgi:hypothetical protein
VNKITKDPSNDYGGFKPITCNNDASIYTNSNWEKLDPIYSHLIEIACLLTLLGFQIMRNKYRTQDQSAKRSW